LSEEGGGVWAGPIRVKQKGRGDQDQKGVEDTCGGGLRRKKRVKRDWGGNLPAQEVWEKRKVQF